MQKAHKLDGNWTADSVFFREVTNFLSQPENQSVYDEICGKSELIIGDRVAVLEVLQLVARKVTEVNPDLTVENEDKLQQIRILI